MKGLAALLGMLLLALVVGCGGGDSSSGPLTKTAFVTQGNEICQEAGESRDSDLKSAAEDEEHQGSSSEELDAYVSEVALPPMWEMTEELGDLEPPKAEQKEVDALIADFEAAFKKVEAEPQLALSGNAFTAVNEAAEGYGLSDCTI